MNQMYMDMKNIEISVVVPVYNRKDYLKESLDSILQQSYPPSEIVIVDDGSTDNLLEIINSYKERVKSLRIENSGAGNARRIGTEATSCPWIAFCDSDDIWLPNHLERKVQLLSEYPDTNFLFSDMLPFGPTALPNRTYFSDALPCWWENLGKQDQHGFINLSNSPYQAFLSFNPVATPTILMTRELYDQVGGINPKYSRMPAEDADLTRKAIAVGNICCDTKVTAKQRRHEQNMSSIETENLLGKIQILSDHIANGLTPKEDIEATLAAIKITKNMAVLSAFYNRQYNIQKQLSKKIKLSDLPTPTKLRLLYLKVMAIFTTK
jgi:glycosyltransferase involved in cell wall biosynthesis